MLALLAECAGSLATQHRLAVCAPSELQLLLTVTQYRELQTAENISRSARQTEPYDSTAVRVWDGQAKSLARSGRAA